MSDQYPKIKTDFTPQQLEQIFAAPSASSAQAAVENRGASKLVGSGGSSALREHADKLAKLLADADWVYSFARQTAGDDVATKEKLTKQRTEAWMALALYRADFSSLNNRDEPRSPEQPLTPER